MPTTEHLYTPAMLAEILGISVRIVRRWHRSGLLSPTLQVLELPYFDFAQLTIARRLAKWMQQGATVQSIVRQLHELRLRTVDSEVPNGWSIEQLPITAEGKRLVLRNGDHFVEATGQLRFGFEGNFSNDQDADHEPPSVTLRFVRPVASSLPVVSKATSRMQRAVETQPLPFEEMIEAAIAAEDDGEFETAIDWYRATLAAYGSDAHICFQLAELLYRIGDLNGARERYFVALEIEPNLVEARANLGCVLAEDGQLELAVAAFEGTLAQFADYADVHFHLARTLDDLGHSSRAAEHWIKFLELSPASPWAEEAENRLRQTTPLLDL